MKPLFHSADPRPFFFFVWERREPRLNRQALVAELKYGIEILGVQLSDPEPVLGVSIK